MEGKRVAGAAVVVLGAAALSYAFVDVRVVYWALGLPRYVTTVSYAVTTLGNAAVWLVLLSSLLLLSLRIRWLKEFRRDCLFLLSSVAASGLVVDLLKVTLARYRPMELVRHMHYGFRFLALGYPVNSFPSGHAATAASVGACLWFLYPRGTWIWVAAAIAVASTRIWQTDHYVSDVLVGAYLGWLAAVCLRRFFLPAEESPPSLSV